jgi:hypothetical protein
LEAVVKFFSLCFGSLLLSSTVWAQPAPANPVQAMIERFTTDRALLDNVYPDPLAPVSHARIAAFDKEWRAKLATVRFDSLDQEGKVDALLLTQHIAREEHAQQLAEKQWGEVEPLLPIAKDVFALEDARRAVERPDAQKTAALLAQMCSTLAAKRKELEADGTKRPNRMTAWRAADDLDLLHARLKLWFTFYNSYDPQFTWWVDQPWKQLDASLTDYTAFLREKMAGIAPDDKVTIIGTPIGRAALQNELADEMIPYTPEELVAMARQQMAWCQSEMIKASRQMGYGDDWHKALEAVKNHYVAPGEQPQMIYKLAKEGEDYVVKNNLVTVPPLASEGWRTDMMTPEQQMVNPFFTGGDTINISYPTDSMTYAQRLMSMRGNNYGFAHATVFHELIPGHWLQMYSIARNRPYRQLFDTPFWIEGNALYWELTLWDHGFDSTPEERIGALFWRMHRCARIIFSLSFHLGQMTPEQATDFLVNEVGHERDNAAAEVRRSFNGSYDPLYQCAYLLGGMQFRALREEVVNSGKMTDKQFNDRVLEENEMPIELLRTLIENKPLTADYKTNWRFLDATVNR